VIILDTGSEISIISCDFCDKLGIASEIVPTDELISGIEGGSMAMAGKVKVKLRLGKDEELSDSCYIDCLVAKDLHFDILIGMDVLRKAMKLDILCSKQLIRYENLKTVKFHKSKALNGMRWIRLRFYLAW